MNSPESISMVEANRPMELMAVNSGGASSYH